MKAHDAESLYFLWNRQSSFYWKRPHDQPAGTMKQKGPLPEQWLGAGSRVAIQYRIVIEPQQSAIVDLIFGVADDAEPATNS